MQPGCVSRTSAAAKEVSGDGEGLPPLFEKRDIYLDKIKEEELSSCKLSKHLTHG